MANTSNRAFRLLSLLQNHRYWAGPDLADRLGVSARTLRRDVDRLRELGYPVVAHPGVDGGYQLAAGAALPPLVVDDDEAVALTAGLLLATQGGLGDSASAGVTIADAAVRALAKVTQVMPARLRRRAEAVAAVTEPATWPGDEARPLPAVSPDVLAGLALACRDSERVRFEYTAGGERTQRHVEPLRLVTLARRWYLVGYDLSRLDWRSFRLDRVAGPVQPTGARFRPRTLPTADAAEFVRQGIAGAAPAGYRVEAVISAPAPAIRDRIGRWALVTEDGPERCRVTIAATDLNWAVIGLGVTGAEFRVLSPPELAERIADWGARFTRSAGSP